MAALSPIDAIKVTLLSMRSLWDCFWKETECTILQGHQSLAEGKAKCRETGYCPLVHSSNGLNSQTGCGQSQTPKSSHVSHMDSRDPRLLPNTYDLPVTRERGELEQTLGP